MEGMKIRSVLIVCMVLHLLIANSEASTLGCYALCAAECVLNKPGVGMVLCLLGCVAKCHQSAANDKIDNQHFCKIGCTASSCTNQPNIDADKFESCVDSCDGICAKKERL
ncbi:hypothetical protein L6164_000909 [Bauhinia variegata]|uniref:Uncharacterized protein n=1 Tax=Bauhinia variegata TaxID=167791 RepID=A0ACB9Q873_BAUVA|nr:hypothetical protein L6164_000909 [Bauhinia variegata]